MSVYNRVLAVLERDEAKQIREMMEAGQAEFLRYLEAGISDEEDYSNEDPDGQDALDQTMADEATEQCALLTWRRLTKPEREEFKKLVAKVSDSAVDEIYFGLDSQLPIDEM